MRKRSRFFAVTAIVLLLIAGVSAFFVGIFESGLYRTYGRVTIAHNPIRMTAHGETLYNIEYEFRGITYQFYHLSEQVFEANHPFPIAIYLNRPRLYRVSDGPSQFPQITFYAASASAILSLACFVYPNIELYTKERKIKK